MADLGPVANPNGLRLSGPVKKREHCGFAVHGPTLVGPCLSEGDDGAGFCTLYPSPVPWPTPVRYVDAMAARTWAETRPLAFAMGLRSRLVKIFLGKEPWYREVPRCTLEGEREEREKAGRK